MHKVTKVIFQQRTQNIIFNMKMASLFLIKCQFENPEGAIKGNPQVAGRLP